MITAKRSVLLILGLAGSVLAAAMLYISAEGMLADDTVFSTESPPLQSVSVNAHFPVSVPGTTLELQGISSYEGPFLEDGSGREVVDIAALHVYNTGSREILKACITVQLAGTEYLFYGENLPPGTTVVLLEQEAKAYVHGTVTDCSGWQETASVEAEIGVEITDLSMGTVIVTNLTDRTLQNVCLYYKSWLSPPDVYVGGISYAVQIPILPPGQTEYLYPSHYATGYSKVVSVTADP